MKVMYVSWIVKAWAHGLRRKLSKLRHEASNTSWLYRKYMKITKLVAATCDVGNLNSDLSLIGVSLSFNENITESTHLGNRLDRAMLRGHKHVKPSHACVNEENCLMFTGR